MKLSFVVPAHNACTWLPHAVASCLEQTHKDIEVVIVNDGSTDRTIELLDWYHKNEKRVVSVNTGRNVGRSQARNLGNDKASGDVILVLDADDIATPNRAEIMARRFAKSDVDYVYGPATVIDAIGHPLYVLGADVFDKNKALSEMQNRIVHSAAAYTKSFAKRFPYREVLSKLGIEDWGQQLEGLMAGAKFDFVPQRLACYRQLDSQITRTRDEKAVLDAKKLFISLLRDVEAGFTEKVTV